MKEVNYGDSTFLQFEGWTRMRIKNHIYIGEIKILKLLLSKFKHRTLLPTP